jgi:hypothetical protein
VIGMCRHEIGATYVRRGSNDFGKDKAVWLKRNKQTKRSLKRQKKKKKKNDSSVTSSFENVLKFYYCTIINGYIQVTAPILLFLDIANS